MVGTEDRVRERGREGQKEKERERESWRRGIVGGWKRGKEEEEKEGKGRRGTLMDENGIVLKVENGFHVALHLIAM